jgi:hypothetical protein
VELIDRCEVLRLQCLDIFAERRQRRNDGFLKVSPFITEVPAALNVSAALCAAAFQHELAAPGHGFSRRDLAAQRIGDAVDECLLPPISEGDGPGVSIIGADV